MSSGSGGQRIRRDEFDIESRSDEHYHHRRGGDDRRSHSNRRSPYSRHRDDDYSRSRSRSRGRYGGGGGSQRRGNSRYSVSRSRSRSRGHSSRRRLDSGSQHSSHSKRYRDSRSRSYSRSRSRSPAYNRRQNRHRDYDTDDRRGGGDYKRRSSKSRSRSRSSSHFRGDRSEKEQSNKKTHKKNLDAIKESDASSNDNSQESKQSQDSNYVGNLEDLPLPQQKDDESKQQNDADKGIYKFDENEPIDRARIHREMEEKLRQALAKEGKVYPPPKPEASHPVFANDGSFLEIFKKMQEQQQLQVKPSTSVAAVVPPAIVNPVVPILAASSVSPATAPYLVATATGKSAPPPPIVGRRKGGKILKTGVVAKPKAQTEVSNDPKDFWSLYLAEVNKYKNTACESEQGNRPLIK